MADKIKRLLIGVPTAPHGNIKVELHQWLCAVSIQAECRRTLHAFHENCGDFKTRLELSDAMAFAGIGWAEMQARILWADQATMDSRQIRRPLIPDGWDVVVANFGGRPIASNRNDMVKHTIRTIDYKAGELIPTSFDALLQIDADCVPTPDALELICTALERDDVDAVSGIYCMIGPDGTPTPIFYRLDSDMRKGRAAHEVLVGDDDLICIQAGVPGGFLAVKKYVFEAFIEASIPWFKDGFRDGSIEAFEIEALTEKHGRGEKFADELLKFHGQRMEADWGVLQNVGDWKIGEDIWFCRHLQALGYKLWVDRRIHVQHYKEAELRRIFFRIEQAARNGFDLGIEAAAKGATDQDSYEAILRENAEQRAAAVDAARDVKKE